MKFTVEKKVFEVLPEACFGIVAAKGIDNKTEQSAVKKLLTLAIAEREAYFEGTKVKEAPEVLPYREAFQTLGINPNKFMSSIEALLTRISKKKGFPSINPIVDLGNAISLKYCLPIGAHDIDTLEGDLTVRFAGPDDTFIPFGETKPEKPETGELIYATGNKVRTRRWIWRQSEQGKITEDTTNVFFPIDGFTSSEEAVIAASKDLAGILEAAFSCDVSVGLITSSNNEFQQI